MRHSSQLKKVFQIWIILLWGATAHAAQSSLTESISGIPIDALGWALVLAGGGGFVATVKKVAEATTAFRNVYLEMFKDLLLSLFAGLLMFGFGMILGLPGPFQVVLIPLAGYAGTRVIERGVEKGLFATLDRVFNALTPGRVKEKDASNDPQTPA